MQINLEDYKEWCKINTIELDNRLVYVCGEHPIYKDNIVRIHIDLDNILFVPLDNKYIYYTIRQQKLNRILNEDINASTSR